MAIIAATPSIAATPWPSTPRGIPVSFAAALMMEYDVLVAEV
jgi:hypothetical protein